MGKEDLMKIFRKNPNIFFSTENLSAFSGISLKSVYAALSKFKEDDGIVYKEFIPKQGPVMKLYGYFKRDDLLEEIKHERNYLNENDKICKNWRIDTQLMMVLIRELKIMNKQIKYFIDKKEVTKNEPTTTFK